MVDFLKIYKGKKVLVTGHTGFKGSWLVIALQKLGAEVSGISLEAQAKDNFHLCGLDKKMDSVIQITDIKSIKKNKRSCLYLIDIFIIPQRIKNINNNPINPNSEAV